MADIETSKPDRPHPQCLKTPGSKCKLRPIVPARFALTSEKTPPLMGSSIYCKDELPTLSNHKFTLRKIWDGYIFITWEGLEDKEILVYKRETGGRFSEVSNHGYGESPYFVSIPTDITEVYMTYVRIPDLEKNFTKNIDKEFGLAQHLADIAKNLLKDNKKRMQRILLEAAPYSAPREEIFNLVEEFRKPDENARLCYLDTWKGSRKYLHPQGIDGEPKLHAVFRQMWTASVDTPDDREDKSVRDFNYPQDTVLVALHDGIGHVYDCSKVYAASCNGMLNFEKTHAVMLLSGYLSHCALESYAAFLKGEVDAKREKYIEQYKLSKNLDTGDYSSPKHMPLSTVMLLDDASACVYAENRDDAEVWVREHKNYDPTKDPKYKELLAYQDIADIETHKTHCENAMKTFTEKVKIILEDWFKLLNEDKNTKYSFSWVLNEIFQADDQATSISKNWTSDSSGQEEPADAKPLTVIRDTVFIHAQSGIGKFIPSAYTNNDRVTCTYFEDLYKGLVAPGNYLELLKFMGKGGIPADSFDLLLDNLGAFLAHCNSSPDHKLRAFAREAEQVFANRFGLTLPEKSTSGANAFLDTFLLSKAVFSVDVDKLRNPLTILDGSKPASDAAWFTNIFAEQLLLKLDPNAKSLIDEINALKAELSKTKKNIPSRKLTEKIKKIQTRLQKTQLFALDFKEASAIMQMNGKPWKASERSSREITAQNIEIHDNYAKASPTPKIQRLQTGTAHLMNFLALCNVTTYSCEIIEDLNRKKYGEAVKNTIYLMPHALTAAECGFKVFGQRALRSWAWKSSLAAGVFADTVMTVDLAMKRDYDAAIGCGIMAATGLGLTVVALAAGGNAASAALMGSLGLASMGTPVTAILFLLFLGGLTIFAACKDNTLEEYLKNGVWSSKMRKERTAIINGTRILCLGSIDEEKKIYPTISQDYAKTCAALDQMRGNARDYMESFYPVVPVLCNTEKHLYFCCNMPASSSGQLKLDLKLYHGEKTLELNATHALEIFEDIRTGQHSFEIILDLIKIKVLVDTMPGSAETESGGYTVSDPYNLFIEFQYQHSNDVKYHKSKMEYFVGPSSVKTENNKIALARLAYLVEQIQKELELGERADEPA